MTGAQPAMELPNGNRQTDGSQIFLALMASLVLHAIAAAAFHGVSSRSIQSPEARAVIVDLISRKIGASADTITRVEQPGAPAQKAASAMKKAPLPAPNASSAVKYALTGFNPKPPLVLAQKNTTQKTIPIRQPIPRSDAKPDPAPKQAITLTKKMVTEPVATRRKVVPNGRAALKQAVKRKVLTSRQQRGRSLRKLGKSRSGKTQGIRYSGSGLSNPRPRYPDAARRRNQQGRVLLTVRVGINGRASSVRISRSSGYPVLDEAALSTVRRWRFRPALRRGQAVAALITVPIRFRLKD